MWWVNKDMKLTDQKCRKAAPAEKVVKLADGNGLYLTIKPTGSKLWHWQYRFNGQQRTAAFGSYPDVSLAEARERRDAGRKLLRDGIDPAQDQGPAQPTLPPRMRLNGTTFRSVADRWLDKRKDELAPSTYQRMKERVEQDALTIIGDRPIEDITPQDMLAMARKIEDRGTIETAKRVKNHCGQIFRFAIAEGLCRYDPSRDINDALKAKPPAKRRTALREADLPVFLSKLNRLQEDSLARQGMLLTLHTFVRTNETRFAVWSEFEGLDGPNPIWRIPAVRMKMGLEHIVPLSRQVIGILDEIRLEDRDDRYLFGAPTKTGVMSENTMLFGLYRMGYQNKATVHGFRGTASTILNESGLFHPDWIERQLAHVERNAVRGAYNAAQYLAQRRTMMQWWSDYLDRQLEEDLIG